MQEAEEAEEQRQAEEAARQAAIVAAERERLLREAVHLKGYLPKGVVQVSSVFAVRWSGLGGVRWGGVRMCAGRMHGRVVRV